MNKKLLLVAVWVCFQFVTVNAQRSIRFTELNYPLKEAVKLVDMHFYQQAYLKLNDYITHFKQENRANQEYENHIALYYFNLCALKLSKLNAEQSFKLFIQETPFLNLQQLGNFELGRYAYEHNHFDDAIRYYEKVGISVLTNKELTQRNFELGYSYLVTQQLDKVDRYFQAAKNIPGEYFKPGNYYHGLLSYYKKDFNEAKKSFTAVKDDERYKKIIPFYLTEIDYQEGEKEKALSTALNYLKSSDKLYYQNELNQMVAQIYCEQDDFENAELYYSKFMNENKSNSSEDYFKLGYCQYQQGKIAEAIPNLEMAAKHEGEVAQHSAYLLAICYLKNGDKENAYKKLASSDKTNMDELQKERIEYTLAKLSYDSGDDKQAYTQLNTFLSNYPNSMYADEANELLAYLNIKSDNFGDAVIAMNKLKNISYNLKKVYQKANYARGIQMLKDENPDRAIFNFEETKKFQIDETTVSLAEFWLSECNYRLGRYSNALAHCDQFLNNADTLSMPDYTRKLHLTKAYIYFHNNDTTKLFEEYPLATGDSNTIDLVSRMGSMKSNFIPEKVPVIDNDPYVLVYNLPEEKIDFAYRPIPIKPLAISTEIRREDQTNYIKVGLGNLSTFEIGAGYNFDDLINMPLYIDFNRTTSKGKIKFQDFNQTHLGVYSNVQVQSHAIDLGFAIDRNKQNYYGYNHSMFNYDNVDLKQVFQNIGLMANIKPMKENEYRIKYKADLYTGIYTDRLGAGEVTLKVDAPISMQLKDDLLAQSDIVVDGSIYSVKTKNTQTNSIISWQPALTKQIELFTIKLGLYPTIGKEFHLLPNVSIQYPFDKKKANFELAWQTNMRLNTFKQLSTLNPFIFNHYQVKQSKNTEVFGSLKGNLLNNLSYSVRSGIGIYTNLPLFLNDTAFDNKQFNIIFEDRASAFIFDATVDYTINSEMMAGAKLNLRPIFDLETNKEAWHYIPSTFDIYGKIRATKEMVLRADLFLISGSKAIERNVLIANPYTRSSSMGIDMNISARYQISKTWNANIDLNNLFGSNYERWYGYPMYGTNVQVSLIHSFRGFKLD